MDYWSETIQDDVYMIAGEGWKDAAKPRLIVETKEDKTKEKPDFKVGKQKFKADLIPATLLIARHFAEEQAAIEALETELGALEQQLDELKEEQSSEGGPLEEVVSGEGEKRKISAKDITAHLKEIAGDKDADEERKALEDYASLLDRQADIKCRLKEARESLEAKIAAKYGKLSEAEIKALIVEDKWLARLASDVQSELDRVSQSLTGRVKELAERYATPLRELTKDVETLAAHVDEHLNKMGAQWN